MAEKNEEPMAEENEEMLPHAADDAARAGDPTPPEKPDYEQEILDLLRGPTPPDEIAGRLEDYHVTDLAQALERLEDEERLRFYTLCPPVLLAEVLEHTDDAGRYLDEMDLERAAAVAAQLETDTAADVLRALDAEKRAAILGRLPRSTRQEIRLVDTFDEDEIGSRLTTNCIVIRRDLTVKRAMSALIAQARENDNVATLFVTDENDVFYGAIDLKDLITADASVPLEDLIQTSFPYVYAHERIVDCIEQLKDYSEEYIPVLGGGNEMLGVITSANLIEVVDDELGEDYAKFAGLTAEEDLKEPLRASLAKRLPWLLVLLALGMAVSAVVGVFERVVSQLTIIMAFQSLILDMAGNVGTQSLAVTIRVLMDESLTGGQKFRLVVKEMRVGMCNGLILGILSFVLVGLYIMLFKHKEALFSFAVSGCIGVSLLLSMLISATLGTCIPLFFKKLKVDPAAASGPLITTVNDLVAVVAYYGMSWILLLNVLHLA